MPHTLAADQDLVKISILGAAGGIGQSMVLLLKTQLHKQLFLNSTRHSHIHLALYDINSDAINGMTTDLSHIDTPLTISGHSPTTVNGIQECLEGTKLIIIPAGIPRKPGMTRDDLFKINAQIVSELADSIIQYADLDSVFILVISNPVNSLVPVMVKKLSKARPDSNIEKRIMGVTKLDIVRASTFLHELIIENNINPRSNNMPQVPVIGGHSGDTIIPIFSKSPFYQDLSQEQLKFLINRVQYGGDEVVRAKNGLGSATLSMALAGYKVVAKFVDLLLDSQTIRGIYYISLWDHLRGKPICDGAKELLELIDNCEFFAIPVHISKNGIYKIDYEIVEQMNDQEKNVMLPTCLENLKKNINVGLNYTEN